MRKQFLRMVSLVVTLTLGLLFISCGDDEDNSVSDVTPSIVTTESKVVSYKDGILTIGDLQYKMIAVEGGTFQMGATPEQEIPENWFWQRPVHNVTLSSYSIGQTEVTQALWKAVMGENNSQYRFWKKGNALPVDDVSWDDCQTFITKLNQMTGQRFRLPTEAEWEFAARGGNKSKGYKYSGSNTIDDVAWYADYVNKQTHPVAKKQSNELGLYDMSGNVAEWCQDWFDNYYYSNSPSSNPTGPSSGSYRVNRGGSVRDGDGDCRVAYRHYSSPTLTLYLGFRLAL